LGNTKISGGKTAQNGDENLNAEGGIMDKQHKKWRLNDKGKVL